MKPSDQDPSTSSIKHCVHSNTFNLIRFNLNFVLLNLDLSTFQNSVDPDQLASDESIRSGSTLLINLFVNISFYHIFGTLFAAVTQSLHMQ